MSDSGHHHGLPWHGSAAAAAAAAAAATSRKRRRWGNSLSGTGVGQSMVWRRSASASPSSAAVSSSAATTPGAQEGVGSNAPTRQGPAAPHAAAADRHDQQLPRCAPFFSQTPPPSNHQRLGFDIVSPSFEAVLAATPWCKQGTALERVEAAVAARKALSLAGESAGGAQKSTGFRMRLDSDDGISDTDSAQETTSSVEVSGKRMKLDETGKLGLLSKRAMKRQKKAMGSLTFSLNEDKLQEFFTTLMEKCRDRSVDEVLELMLKYYQPKATPKQKGQMRKCFAKFPAVGLLNYSVSQLMMSSRELLNILNPIPEQLDQGLCKWKNLFL